MSINKKIKKKLKKILYNLVRTGYIRESICNIGKIVEEDDKITCYVSQKKLEKNRKESTIYDLNLNGVNNLGDRNKETIKKFGLDKPIYYIFENIEFKSGLEIKSRWAHVVFKNCTFNKNIGIFWAEDLVFENNKYVDSCPVYFLGNCFFYGNNIEKITFINDQFINSYELKKYSENPNFGMKIEALLVEFIDSKIKVDYPAEMDINAEKIVAINSHIMSDIYFNSKSINFDEKSLIESQNGAIIENENGDFKNDIQSSMILYNNVDMTNKKETICRVDEDEKNLKLSRIALIEKLRDLSNYCNQINENKIQNIKNKFDNQSVNKVLKKK